MMRIIEKQNSMFFMHFQTGKIVEAIEPGAVFDPFVESIQARSQAYEDAMDIDSYQKSELLFPSGEPLPLCWRDSRYRDHAA